MDGFPASELGDYFVKQQQQAIFVMAKCSVFFGYGLLS